MKSYAPTLEAEHGELAEAFQLRYLARRAVKSGDGYTALRLMHQACALAPTMVVQEPLRTAATYAAAVLRAAIPQSLGDRALSFAMSFVKPAPRIRN